jgi:hypothetical protein
VLGTGCYYSRRLDHRRFDAPLPDAVACRGRPYPGADLFAFTRQWWQGDAAGFPDVLLGAEGWDGVLMEIMRRSGFQETTPAIYHEAHDAYWVRHRHSNPAQQYNRRLIRAWIERNGAADFLGPDC